MIADSVIARIRASIDLVELVSSRGVALKRSGSGFKGLCPIHNETTPSFHVNPARQSYKCFGCGAGGDAIAFLMQLDGLEFRDAITVLAGRAGITIDEQLRPSRPPRTSATPHTIAWPEELIEGSAATWAGFAESRGYSYAGVWVMVHAGLLRFTRVRSAECFVLTDDRRRAAEIRRLDGEKFGEHKAFPLSGVDKRWLPGFDLYESGLEQNFIITEGATDFLAAVDLFTRYRRAGGKRSWLPLACLGASVTNFDPEIVAAMSGRDVLLVPDGDDAGRRWRDRLTPILLRAGARVDAVEMPEGKDLSDIAPELEPEDLCDAFGNGRS